MTKMRIFNSSLASLIVVAMATYAGAQEPAKQPVVKSEFQTVEATVEAINPATRELTLRGPNGPVSVVLGPDVRNFDKVHVGDKVVVSYYQGLAPNVEGRHEGHGADCLDIWLSRAGR